MIALLIGLVIGFVMCIPIGPINLMVINTQIKHQSKSRALAIAAGGSLMDLFYFLLILSGLSFITFSEEVTKGLKISGLVLIFGLGIKDLLAKETTSNENTKSDTNKLNILASFILGVVIYTSNPTLIVTMTGLGAFIKSLELFQFDTLNIVLNSLGLATGSFLWFAVLSSITGKFEEKIRTKYLIHFNRISGVLMILLSIFMGLKLF
ncbi:MAG: LysE family transporter [Bdellovibrio sp.]